MKILLVGAGASYSTKDVEDGYRKAFKRAGHEVIYYALDGRIEVAGGFLTQAWERKKQEQPEYPEPTDADIIYLASQGVIERALRFMPDWVLVVSGMYFHPDMVVLLKRAGMKVAILLTESPYDDDEQAKVARECDVVFTNERSSVKVLKEANPSTYYLPHAYDPTKHTRLPALVDEKVDAHDVVFVGTGFTERQELLEGVDWTGIDFGLYGHWPLLDEDSPLHAHLTNKVVDNTVTAALYRKATIGLNLYRTSRGFGVDAEHVIRAESMNPRALELAATGTFTLSQYRDEVDEVFGDTVPTFETPAECEQMIRRYLDDDDARRWCEVRLPKKVAGRTYERQAQYIVDTLTDAQLFWVA